MIRRESFAEGLRGQGGSAEADGRPGRGDAELQTSPPPPLAASGRGPDGLATGLCLAGRTRRLRSIVIHDRPVFDSTSLEVPTATTPAPAEPLALVQAGVALDKKHPEWAVTYYRDAALKALPYLRSDELSPQLDIDTATGAAQGIYRRAIEYMLETTHRQAMVEGVSWTEFLARAGIGVQGRVGLYEAAQ